MCPPAGDWKMLIPTSPLPPLAYSGSAPSEARAAAAAAAIQDAVKPDLQAPTPPSPPSPLLPTPPPPLPFSLFSHPPPAHPMRPRPLTWRRSLIREMRRRRRGAVFLQGSKVSCACRRLAVSQPGVREGASVSGSSDTRRRVEMNRSALFVPGGAAAV